MRRRAFAAGHLACRWREGRGGLGPGRGCGSICPALAAIGGFEVVGQTGELGRLPYCFGILGVLVAAGRIGVVDA